tara:strand:+ start:723 stop:1367 length:645 start_codon:yes stop_codon:yes gene_type:complete
MSEMLGLGSNNQAPMNNGALNLGVSSQQPMQQGWGAQPQQPAFGQMAQNPFIQGMTGGASAQWGQQPVAPPSEIEMQILLLRGIVPLDRFMASPQMGTLIQLLNNLVSFSVLEVMKNAVFTEDGDGNLKMDITKLPSHLQTMSAENIKADFNSLQSTAQQNITAAENGQQQIAMMAQQSLMGGALSAALADEGMMEKMGTGVGNVARGLIFGRQ